MDYQLPDLSGLKRVSVALLPDIGTLCPGVTIDSPRYRVRGLCAKLRGDGFYLIRRDGSSRLILANLRTPCTTFVFDRDRPLRGDRSESFSAEFEALSGSRAWVVGVRDVPGAANTTLFLECGYPADSA